jgi:hypothetical protein
MHIMNSLPVCGLFVAESHEIKDSMENLNDGYGMDL